MKEQKKPPVDDHGILIISDIVTDTLNARQQRVPPIRPGRPTRDDKWEVLRALAQLVADSKPYTHLRASARGSFRMNKQLQDLVGKHRRWFEDMVQLYASKLNSK